jgi:hypothetical protein
MMMKFKGLILLSFCGLLSACGGSSGGGSDGGSSGNPNESIDPIEIPDMILLGEFADKLASPKDSELKLFSLSNDSSGSKIMTISDEVGKKHLEITASLYNDEGSWVMKGDRLTINDEVHTFPLVEIFPARCLYDTVSSSFYSDQGSYFVISSSSSRFLDVGPTPPVEYCKISYSVTVDGVHNKTNWFEVEYLEESRRGHSVTVDSLKYDIRQ